MARAMRGISFVVPVYNKERYLPRVLAAIRGQAGDFEREYIFVNDGSTDGSLALLGTLTAGWGNVTIADQDNHGSAHATNQGIERARYPFIKFVDADDLITVDATETLLRALEANPEACLAFGTAAVYDDAAAVDLAVTAKAPKTTLIAEPLLPAIRNSMFNPSQALARTKACQSVGGCDERIVFSQEYGLTLRLAKRWPFVAVETPVTFWPRRMEGRLSDDKARQLQRVTLACAYFIKDHPDLPVSTKHYACRRAAGRAWKYTRRHLGAGPTSRWFWFNLRSRLPMRRGFADFIEDCASAFDGAGSARTRAS